jgi:hypothetical protein
MDRELSEWMEEVGGAGWGRDGWKEEGMDGCREGWDEGGNERVRE